MSATRRWCALVWIGLACVGCGGVEHPETVPVKGSVVYKGEPVKGGTIIFLPAAENQGHRGTAVIGSDGTFVAGTFEPNDGLVPGQYKVGVESIIQEGETAGKDPAGPKTGVPVKFANPHESKVTLTVAAGGQDNVTLELKD